MDTRQKLLRDIPKVDILLAQAQTIPELAELPHVHLLTAIRKTLEQLRQDILAGRVENRPDFEALLEAVKTAAESEMAFSLRPVINATGVVIHTNLGRSILSRSIAEHVAKVASSYSTLEYDLASGERGSRHAHVARLLTRLTGSEAAMAVNNNAAAVLLILSALFKDREVVVSRGELVEIGGAFRIPAIMEQGGAILKEVGTTNRTRLADFAKAVDPERTGGLLKVHTSNFRIVGYTEETPLPDLVKLGRQWNLPVVCDLGSGPFFSLQPLGIHDEPTVTQMLNDGADLVCFSGDKLLGGAQAGIIVGRKDLMDKLKAHPLARALRVDKLTLAALEATLKVYLDPEEAKKSIPTVSMLFAEKETLRNKAFDLNQLLTAIPGLNSEVVPAESQTGGGSAPEKPLPTWAVAVESPKFSAQELERLLRLNPMPIIARINQDRLLLDVRTITPDDFPEIAGAFKKACV